MIIPLDPTNREHRQAAADLHMSLLGDESPIPQLGERFCRDFYYGAMIRDGMLKCDLAVHDGRYIGWISYTTDPLNFMQMGLKRHFFFLSMIFLLGVIVKPVLIRTILGVIRDMRGRKTMATSPDEEPFGEILSFGVLEDSGMLSDPETGERYSKAFVDKAIEYFRKEGFSKFRVAVRRWYKAALIFYLSYGPKIIDKHYDRDRSYRLEFLL